MAAPAYAADSTGSISGTFTVDGQASFGASLEITNTSGFFDYVDLDVSGAFQVADLAPGQYQLEFSYPNGPSQWYHGKASGGEADPVTVVAGQDTRVDEQSLPTGTVAGTLTDSSGSPMSGAFVNVTSPDGWQNLFTSTDASGHYSVAALPGSYTVSFQPQQYPELRATVPGSSQPATYTVAVGATTTADEQLPPTGTMSGRFTTADGQPASNVSVSVYLPGVDYDASGEGSATTDDNGDFTLPYLYAGAGYVVEFSDWNTGITQWAYGAVNEADAADVTITAGTDTVVNDRALGAGSIAVTAKDSATGKSIADFCAGSDGHEACSNGTGQVVLTGVRAGAESVYAYTNDARYFQPDDRTATVVAGQTASVTFAMTPGATIDTVVKDAATGAPVADVCVVPYSGTKFAASDGFGYCSDSQGVVHIGPLAKGSYRLYVGAERTATYGDQWLGANGGVGTMAAAQVVKVNAGKEVTAPPVRLDHAGTVTGAVTDATGHPVADALIANSASEPGSGATYRSSVTDATGHYTVTGLGPYAWPLFVNPQTTVPWQWTGGVANYAKASTVAVNAGATVTANVGLALGVKLTGTVRGPDGTLDTSGRVVAYNVASGNPIGVAELNSDGTYSLPLIGSQNVKLRFEAYQESEHEGWYGGTDFTSATPVDVPAHKNLSLNLTIG
ncbi:MAG TPA: carboxypeptidase regulatory-like domain-containing protein [Rugosimonospora sp.]